LIEKFKQRRLSRKLLGHIG